MAAISGTPMFEVLRDFVDKTTQAGIPYMITGSFAMGLYGEIRFTRDIDIVIELPQDKAEEFFNLFEETYYISKGSVERAVKAGKMFNIIHLEQSVKIDCVILKNNEFEKLKFSRRFEKQVGEVKFWTITKEDLILSKLMWTKGSYSDMQIRDITQLINNEYDEKYVQTWVEKLSLQEIWGEVLQWKIRRPK